MGLECTARINGIFSIIVMGVTTCLFRTAARPMLHHRIHTVIAPSVCNLGLAGTGLEAIHICTGHIGIKLRTLSESTIETCPSRLGCEVDLRRKSSSDTKSAVFLRSDLAELLYKSRIECCRQAKRCRPVRDLATCTIVVFRCGRCLVTRVGRCVDRNSVSHTFDQHLHVIVPAGSNFWRFYGSHQNRPEVILCQELPLGIRKIGSLCSALCIRFPSICSTTEHSAA